MGDLFLSEDMQALLLNKSVWIIGDSVQRTIYKDFVTLLQENYFSTYFGLKLKGEKSYMGDELLEGGELSGPLHNGTDYREHRLFQTPHHQVRFIFITRVWDRYWEDRVVPLLKDEEPPDVVIVNSCLWDLTRYGRQGGVGTYKEDLNTMLDQMRKILPPRCMFIWNTTLPLSSDPEKIHGGFLVAEVSVEDKMNLRLDILEANKFASDAVVAHNYDVVDLHYWFRGYQSYRVKDGIHWDSESTRQMTNLLLSHISISWGLGFPGRLFQLARYCRDPLLKKELEEAARDMEEAKKAEPATTHEAAIFGPLGSQNTTTTTTRANSVSSDSGCRKEEGSLTKSPAKSVKFFLDRK